MSYNIEFTVNPNLLNFKGMKLKQFLIEFDYLSVLKG